MRAGILLVSLALAALAGCSLIVDPASEDGFLCGADNYCPDGFVCDAEKGECIRGQAGADADADGGADSSSEEDREAAADADA